MVLGRISVIFNFCKWDIFHLSQGGHRGVDCYCGGPVIQEQWSMPVDGTVPGVTWRPWDNQVSKKDVEHLPNFVNMDVPIHKLSGTVLNKSTKSLWVSNMQSCKSAVNLSYSRCYLTFVLAYARPFITNSCVCVVIIIILPPALKIYSTCVRCAQLLCVNMKGGLLGRFMLVWSMEDWFIVWV